MTCPLSERLLSCCSERIRNSPTWQCTLLQMGVPNCVEQVSIRLRACFGTVRKDRTLQTQNRRANKCQLNVGNFLQKPTALLALTWSDRGTETAQPRGAAWQRRKRRLEVSRHAAPVSSSLGLYWEQLRAIECYGIGRASDAVTIPDCCIFSCRLAALRFVSLPSSVRAHFAVTYLSPRTAESGGHSRAA